MFLDYFDLLILKIIFKIKKNIILIHFQVKNTLNRNYYHISKYTRKFFYLSMYFYTIIKVLK
jgi:hypothetical protein